MNKCYVHQEFDFVYILLLNPSQVLYVPIPAGLPKINKLFYFKSFMCNQLNKRKTVRLCMKISCIYSSPQIHYFHHSDNLLLYE